MGVRVGVVVSVKFGLRVDVVVRVNVAVEVGTKEQALLFYERRRVG
jgi:hypothetical protein